MKAFGQLVYHRCNGNARNVMPSMDRGKLKLQSQCECGSWDVAFATLGPKFVLVCICGKEYGWKYA